MYIVPQIDSWHAFQYITFFGGGLLSIHLGTTMLAKPQKTGILTPNPPMLQGTPVLDMFLVTSAGEMSPCHTIWIS